MISAATRSSMGGVRRVMVKATRKGQGQGKVWRRELSDQPIPHDLKRTVHGYLRYVHPLVTADRFNYTVQLSEQFLKGPGPDLQHLFYEFAQNCTNWVKLTYLWQLDHWSERPSLFYMMSGSFFPALASVRGLNEQLWLAARIISALLDLKWSLDNGEVETQRMGGQGLCMSCFRYIFSSCRVPAVLRDRFLVYPSAPPLTRHINVIYHNQICSIDVCGEGGRALSTEQLYEQLKRVTEQLSSGGPEGVGVGALTALHRDTWAEVYQDLAQDGNNRAVMDNIQRSLFVLSLDQPIVTSTTTTTTRASTHPLPDPPPTTTTTPTSPTSSNALKLRVTHQETDAHQMFLGGGVEFNSCNRWLDKTLQVVVGAGGKWGILTEHSAFDGTHGQMITDHVNDFVRTEGSGRDIGVPDSQVRSPVRLRLNLTPKVISAIGEAKEVLKSLEETTNMSTLTVWGVGKKVMEGWGVSPDSFIQMALHLAYFRTHQRPCSAVEFISKRCHPLGRLDRLLSTTPEAVAFSQHMDSPNLSNAHKQRLLKQALDAHNRQVKEVKSGYSIHSHLHALEMMALRYDYPFRHLFLDLTFVTAFSFNVSSSQGRRKHEATICYHGEKDDSYSCPYTLYDDHINFNVISDRRYHPTQSGIGSDGMDNNLLSALSDMRHCFHTNDSTIKLLSHSRL